MSAVTRFEFPQSGLRVWREGHGQGNGVVTYDDYVVRNTQLEELATEAVAVCSALGSADAAQPLTGPQVLLALRDAIGEIKRLKANLERLTAEYDSDKYDSNRNDPWWMDTRFDEIIASRLKEPEVIPSEDV